jgi:glucosamine-6-phosphate deaminase
MIRRFADGVALGEALASEIADRVEGILADGGRFVLGCPGGRTPITTYTALASEFARRGTDLGDLVIAMMDDYVVSDGDTWAHIPADAHNSCRRFAHIEIQAVLNELVAPGRRLPDENVWFPDATHPTAYDGRLREAGGIDFFILASGAGDGHVAFNPPGSPIDSRSRVVELAQQTRRDNLATFPDYEGIDDVPTHGVTVGIATIAELSGAAAMILIGADKRQAFERLTESTGYDSSWPATVWHLIDGAELLVDDAASRTP